MKKATTLLLILCIILSSVSFSFGTVPELSIIGQSAILIDGTTGQVLYEKNIHEQHYPASTTKMMTGILALENLRLLDSVDIDADTPFTEGSRIYLLEGENVNVRDVLYGLFLESANDSAVALAKKVSGSVEEFSKLMNKKAKEVGAKNTHFVNPNGLHEDNHMSTAYDLAMIAKYAMKNQTFRDYVSTYQYTMEATNLQETRYLYNTNRLLYDTVNKVVVNGVTRPCKYEGVTGIKTGYTSKAGGCLVASAKRGNTELIAVTMASTDMGRFADCIALLDYGFENYKTVEAISNGKDIGTVPVKRGAVKRVPVAIAEDAYATLPLEASENLIRTEVQLFDYLKAPVDEGQKAGVVKVYMGDELLGEYEAAAVETIDRGGILSVIGISDILAKKIRNIMLSVLGVLFLLLVFYIILKRKQVKRKRIIRQQQRKKLRRLKEKERSRWDEEYWRSRPL
ncbi:MAG: D-alanyl-D-alanine carboxypeptidase [Eubacteriales bacterium]|nr:D-alanyl-D-alanine carboxypeptidase [Eubacteriales bacterium]